jgi:hypothetical protein
MTFLNTKEQVIDLVLTKLGEEKLSMGKLNPTYYEFFDDEILYESEKGFLSLSQNEIEQNIKSNLRVLEQQNNFKALDPNHPQRIVDKGVICPIGNSSYGTQQSPSWSFNVYDGKITRAEKVLYGVEYDQQYIPQIDVQSEYVITKNLTEGKKNSGEPIFLTNQGETVWYEYEDLTFVLSELNTDLRKDKFEIEIWEDEEGGRTKLTKEDVKKLFEITIDNEVVIPIKLVRPEASGMFIPNCDIQEPTRRNTSSENIYITNDEPFPEEC